MHAFCSDPFQSWILRRSYRPDWLHSHNGYHRHFHPSAISARANCREAKASFRHWRIWNQHGNFSRIEQIWLEEVKSESVELWRDFKLVRCWRRWRAKDSKLPPPPRSATFHRCGRLFNAAALFQVTAYLKFKETKCVLIKNARLYPGTTLNSKLLRPQSRRSSLTTGATQKKRSPPQKSYSVAGLSINFSLLIILSAEANPCWLSDQLFVKWNFAKNGWARRS